MNATHGEAELALPLGPWSSLSPMGEFVECGDESPHSILGGLNDDQGPLPVKASLDTVVGLTGY